MNGRRGYSARSEELRFPARSRLLCVLGQDQDWLVHNELTDVLSGHKLGVSVIDHFVNDLVDKHKVLSNALLVEYTTVVTENLHHSVDDIENGGWRDICLASCHEVDSEFLGEEIIDTIHMLRNRR